jgi:Macrocin-O-methyltransferase (TylF).|tara:strand:+ start:175 stop:831 length:657 start_codon:yes stop_codon:yes gene_type:complete
MNDEKKIWNGYHDLLISNDVSRLRKMFSRYELFKKTLNVPGDIIECGVFKGVSFLFWLKCIKIFLPNSTKKVVGFDMFSGFPKDLKNQEKKSAKKYVKESDFSGINPKKLSELALKILPKEHHELIVGNISKTSKEYVKNNYGFKISLLHLDLDTFNGTKASLDNFFPLMSKGGIIILDEYGQRGWGETEAVDKFLKNKNCKVELFENTNSPTGYIVV